MTIEQFIRFVKTHSQTFDTSTIFSLNALCGELGELANVIKKRQFHIAFRNGMNPVSKKNLKPYNDINYKLTLIDEAGDVLFYLMQVLNREGINLEDVIIAQELKINKQSELYKVNFVK